LGSGAILGIHWVCFFQGIRVSSVAVGMIAAFTFPVITAVVEPIVFRERMRRRTLVAASVVMVGVALLALEPSQGGNTLLGIGFGLTASTLFVARNLVSRRAVEVVGGVRAMAVQVAVAGVLLAPFLARLDALPTGPQWVGLLYLGIVPTAITHTLFIRSFKHFSIATASVITTLQLGYGPVYAWLVMDEVPGWPVLVGGTIVLGAVAWESVASARDRR
jgi:drug/metabolite transporter (DMT)-like permease